jgi:hypothetical protein
VDTCASLYPEWIDYLKDRQPKTLIMWGRNDPLDSWCSLQTLAYANVSVNTIV